MKTRIDLEQLATNLKDARYKTLVACRPLGPARVAFNLALQAVAETLKAQGDCNQVAVANEFFNGLRFTE